MKAFFGFTIALVLFFLVAFFNSDVKAQGTWSCYWSTSAGICGRVSSCAGGYELPSANPCSGKPQAQCTSGTGGDCVLASGNINLTVNNGPSITGGCIDTAVGCIPISSEQGLATFFLGWAMGIGGGIALILIVISTFMIMTSEGDPRKLQAGKELLTSAISGLILLVFSAYILRVIGVDLLQIFEE